MKPKSPSTRPKKHATHHSSSIHSHQHVSSMDKVKIKRVKHNTKTVTAKEKILAGLGVGGALLGGGMSMTSKPAQTQFTRTNQQSQSDTSSRIKAALGNFFKDSVGVSKAYADDDSEVENMETDGQVTNTTNDDEVENSENTDSSSNSGTDNNSANNDNEVENSESSGSAAQLTASSLDLNSGGSNNNGETGTGNTGSSTNSSDGPTFTTVTLPSASVGQNYSASVHANGSSVTYQLNGGTLPPGLSFTANGNITGAPTLPGTYIFNVEATDASGLGNIGQFVISVVGSPATGAVVQSYTPPSQTASTSSYLGMPAGQSEVSGAQIQNSSTSATSYKVKKGDTLWGISQKFYGTGTQWRKILSANPSSLSKPGNVKTLRIGYELSIPPASSMAGAQTQSFAAQTQSISPASGTTYQVQKGDTLSAISQKYYGDAAKWPVILSANTSKISSPRNLQIGTVLTIPGASSAAPAAQTQSLQTQSSSAPVINNYQNPPPAAPVNQSSSSSSQDSNVVHLNSFSQTLGDNEVENQE